MPVTCPRCGFENPEDTNYCGRCRTPLGSQDTPTGSATQTLDSTDETFETGAVVAGRYRIVECLGQGGMGKVYKARDLEVHEDVALKLIRPDIAADATIIRRFRNELRLARKIAHRNVCRMFDLGRAGPTRFITMEYVPGEDLKSTLRRIGPLPLRKVLAIGRQVCQGLSEAHDAGVIHRDLKPSNIMIDKDGDVRIMDFGIARSGETEGLTVQDAVVGTIPYLAPELFTEGGKPGIASDIYALGVILYEMVTGHLPFQGGAPPASTGRPTNAPPETPSASNPEIPPALDGMILKCLARDPGRRFRRSEDVCAEMGRIEESLTPARWRGAWSRFGTTFGHKAGLKRIVLVGLPLTAAAVAAVILLRPPSAREPTPVQPWRNSIIVLPFEHLNPRPDQDYLWPTVMDRIIRSLEKFPELMVIQYKTALQFEGQAPSAEEIREKTGAGNALEGAIRTTEAGLEIRVGLRNLESRSTVFSRIYPSTEKDLYSDLDKISKAVAENLGLRSVDTRYPGIKPRGSTDPRVNRYYAYGLSFQDAYLVSESEADFASCIGNYRKALEIDPGFSLAYWQMGIVYEVKYTLEKREDDEEEMVRMWRRAYDSDPDLAEANLGMGWIYFNREDHRRAFRFFSRAYELDVNNAQVNFHIGAFLRSLGLFGQARTHYARALELEPKPGDFAVWQRVLADCYSEMGQTRAAAGVLREATDVSGDASLALDYAVCLLKLGEYDEAEKRIGEVRRLAGAPGKTFRHEALLCALTGRPDEAQALMKNETQPSHQIAVAVYALLGQKARAIEGIRLGSGSEGFRKYRWYPYSYLVLKNNPFFESLRDDPAFRSIIGKAKALYEERARRFGAL